MERAMETVTETSVDAAGSTASMRQTLLVQQRIHKARVLLHHAASSSIDGSSPTDYSTAAAAELEYSERILQHACAVIELYYQDFAAFHASHASHDQLQQQQHKQNQRNPFSAHLAKAKRRLAQVSLLLGKLNLACNLFLQVIFNHSATLSPTALAMTWYDVALVYLHQDKYQHSQAALNQAIVVIQNKPREADAVCFFAPNGMRIGPDETMLFFIHQALLKLQRATATSGTDQQQQQQQQHQQLVLPWSVQFTNYGSASGSNNIPDHTSASSSAISNDAPDRIHVHQPSGAQIVDDPLDGMTYFDEEESVDDRDDYGDDYDEETERLMELSQRAAGAA